jgi:hypothetical protein
MGREHEEDIVKEFEWDKAHRSRSSGASYHDPVDITTESLVIECECTDSDSYRLTKAFWNEVRGKQHTGKMPALAIRFRDAVHGKHTDLMAISAEDLSSLMEEVETYRTMALERDDH